MYAMQITKISESQMEWSYYKTHGNGQTDFIRSFMVNDVTWPRGYKTFYMLNSIEHEIFHAHKC